MIKQDMNMSIQRDQNLVIRPKEKKKKDQNLVICPKEKAKTGPSQNIHTSV
jgi:antitoxin component of MazEF toxin-antitoxin module